MTSVEYVREVCSRLGEELRAGAVSRLRLRQIETLVRLMTPHLIQAIAEEVHIAGPTPSLERAREALRTVRVQIEWVADHRDVAHIRDIQRILAGIVADIDAIAREVDRV